jgi:hypothetical protein
LLHVLLTDGSNCNTKPSVWCLVISTVVAGFTPFIRPRFCPSTCATSTPSRHFLLLGAAYPLFAASLVDPQPKSPFLSQPAVPTTLPQTLNAPPTRCCSPESRALLRFQLVASKSVCLQSWRLSEVSVHSRISRDVPEEPFRLHLEDIDVLHSEILRFHGELLLYLSVDVLVCAVKVESSSGLCLHSLCFGKCTSIAHCFLSTVKCRADSST